MRSEAQKFSSFDRRVEELFVRKKACVDLADDGTCSSYFTI